MGEPNTEAMEPCIFCKGQGYTAYSRGRIRCLECNNTGMVPLGQQKQEKRLRKALTFAFLAVMFAVGLFLIIDDPSHFLVAIIINGVGALLVGLAWVIAKVGGEE